ncbi:jg21127 [Pararge aegeria aegeria]|uniref:Jg21127 protein n=1 Tax=Pararge aegeria aegeria TaxID=348720 RepID=A0A8S4RBL6_9NEOP|nr:jg21127 [Pararge aegeria aegeria]
MWDDVVEETPAAPAPEAAPAAPDAAPAGDAPAAAGEPAKAEEAEPPPPQKLENAADKRLVCKHWVRSVSNKYTFIKVPGRLALNK